MLPVSCPQPKELREFERMWSREEVDVSPRVLNVKFSGFSTKKLDEVFFS